MENVAELVELLTCRDSKLACGAARQLVELSGESTQVYPWFDYFSQLLENKNSLVRNRSLELIAANALWDEEGKTAALLERYLSHITDEKPITARQCIKALPRLAAGRPELSGRICAALQQADVSFYPDSMRPLVQQDLLRALALIQAEQPETGEKTANSPARSETGQAGRE